MNNDVTFKEILNYVNHEHNNKANCSIGLFVNVYSDEGSQEIDQLIVKKPIVAISSFMEDNEVYYDIGFQFKSYNDADYKQLWKFICKYAEKAKNENRRMESGEVLEKVTILTMSILPDKYNGKYFVNVDVPYAETFVRSENAYDDTASISFVCNDENFQILRSDDDMIDPRSIEREAEQELLAEQD